MLLVIFWKKSKGVLRVGILIRFHKLVNLFLLRWWPFLFLPMLWALSCFLIIFVTNWIWPLKISGGVSRRISPIIYPYYPGILFVCPKIRVVWAFVLWMMLISLLSQSLVGSFFRLITVSGFLCSRLNISNMGIFLLVPCLLILLSGMVLNLLCLSCDQVLVLFLISQVLFQFGFLLGFLRYLIFG
jgi:hypothetical protein